MSKRKGGTAAASGMLRGSVVTRDQVDHTVKAITLGSGLGAVVATGVFIGALVPSKPSQAAPAPSQPQVQQQQDDGSSSDDGFSGGGGFFQGSGGGPPVVTSGSS
ncbi:MAG: hypothetical protein WCD35_03245 [Mycobacteriales bacterium]